MGKIGVQKRCDGIPAQFALNTGRMRLVTGALKNL
jgi:hypothetical protein